MPEGGTLTVRVFDDVPASRVVLTVRDTGHGMDAQTRTQLFEPFFTTKARGQGTGLGLATVFGIVRALGGQIEVDTVPDRGTVFRILLPRAEGAGVVSGPRVASDLHGHETVLVVDDEHTIVELASRTLLEYGYSVVQATGPGAAMVAFAERAGRIDLVLTDIMMPDMTGRALVERLRRRDRGLAVLYMSGYSDPALDEAMPADPTDPLIAKPFTPRQLAEAVRATLASRHPTA
jgi:CheY-like chemotaxis protein